MTRLDLDCGDRPEGLEALPKFRAALAAWMARWEKVRDCPGGAATAEIVVRRTGCQLLLIVYLAIDEDHWQVAAWDAGRLEATRTARQIEAKLTKELEEARLRLFLAFYGTMMRPD